MTIEKIRVRIGKEVFKFPCRIDELGKVERLYNRPATHSTILKKLDFFKVRHIIETLHGRQFEITKIDNPYKNEMQVTTTRVDKRIKRMSELFIEVYLREINE